MVAPRPSRLELSTALNKALTPLMLDLGFFAVDRPDDDPIYKVWHTSDDWADGRRFLRAAPLGYDTFHCWFTQFSDLEVGGRAIDIGTEIGIHIEAFEELQLKLSIPLNPSRVGRHFSNIWRIQPELTRFSSLEEVYKIAHSIMKMVNSDGISFWSEHTSYDDVQSHFETWSVDDRHSPKGGAHVSRYLMLTSYLKNDRELFDQIIQEYRPHLGFGIYRDSFEELVQALTKAFETKNG